MNQKTMIENGVDLEVIPDEQRSFIQAELLNLSTEIMELKVTNREQYEKGLNLGIANSNILKRVEDLRKALLAPYKAQTDRINDKFRGITEVFSVNDEQIRSKLVAYASRVNVENIKTINTDMGRATIQERADFKITDQAKVPREYLKLDETKVRRAAVAGLLDGADWVQVTRKLTPAFTAK